MRYDFGFCGHALHRRHQGRFPAALEAELGEGSILRLPSPQNRRLAQHLIVAVDQKRDMVPGGIRQRENLIGVGVAIPAVQEVVRGPAVRDYAAMDCLKRPRFIGGTLQAG